MPDPQSDQDLSPATLAVHAGRPPHTPDQPLNAPLTPASTYVAGGDLEYGRYGNPTWTAFEAALGALEGGSCLAFGSGLAGAAAILSLVANGEKVVVPQHAYQGTLGQLDDLAARGRAVPHRVDVTDPAAVLAACDDASLVWLETPTNPALEVIDLTPVIEAAHEAGAYVVVDNTFATPLRQRPLELGADLVLHSATKLIAGHSDALLGAVVTRDDELLRVLKGRRDLDGASPGVLEAWLALRGLRTLPVRLDRAEATARELAERLAAHPGVVEARYPGFGTIVALVLEGPDQADLLVRSTKLWVHATSLGGVESTFERRRRWATEAATIPEGLVRLSVGLEDVEDLWRDLAGGLPTGG